MAATKSKRVNTRSGRMDFRMPVGYKKVLGLVRSTDTLSTLHSQLEASSIFLIERVVLVFLRLP